MHLWKSGFLRSHSEETKKGKVFGILCQLKNLGKFVVHAHNNTFLAVRNGLLLPPKISATEGRHTVY
jgi:hypothetical protein